MLRHNAVTGFLVLGCVGLRATTVEDRVVVCPLCSRDFIGPAVASFTNGAEPARDLGNSPWIIATQVWTCPHCLYSFLSSDETPLRDEEKERLKSCLGDLPQLASVEARHSPGFWLARLCSSRRDPDPRREATIDLLCYYRGNSRTVDAGRAAATIARALLEGAYEGDEKLVFTYLAGELNRRAGNLEEARRWFRATIDLAGEQASAAGSQRNSRLIAWAREQLEAASAASGFAPGRPREQRARESPETEKDQFLEWLLGCGEEMGPRTIAAGSGDTLLTISSRMDVSWLLLMDLNPGVKDPGDPLGAGDPIRVPNLPPGYSEQRVLGELPRLIEAGNVEAIRYLLHWARSKRGAKERIDERYLLRCVEGLCRRPELWPWVLQEVAVDVGEFTSFEAYLLKVTEAAPDFSDWIRQLRNGSRDRAVFLGVMARRGDPAAIEVVMQVLEREGMSRECADYLERVGGEQVIQRLEALIRQSGPRKEERQAEGSETKGARAGSKLRRREVEDLIRAIRLRPFAGE